MVSEARRKALDEGRPLGRATFMARFDGSPEVKRAYFSALAKRSHRNRRPKRDQGNGSG
jgi:hypothetical protein